MRRVLLFLLLPSSVRAQAQAGWGNGTPPGETGFSWTDPLWPDLWMAWTPATFAVFAGIFSMIAVIGVLEGLWFHDGLERRGILGLTTTLGDRLFITLLGAVFIFLAWLGFAGQPVWIPLILAATWGLFVFWQV
ncbi:MAG: DUF2160 domain-containing protein [Rhodobacteraceae bacterium]|nr:DUF2160 domain-containing protein [Paracoccaceae bacterium]